MKKGGGGKEKRKGKTRNETRVLEEEGRRLRNWSRIEEKRRNDKVRIEMKEREEGKEVS